MKQRTKKSILLLSILVLSLCMAFPVSANCERLFSFSVEDDFMSLNDIGKIKKLEYKKCQGYSFRLPQSAARPVVQAADLYLEADEAAFNSRMP